MDNPDANRSAPASSPAIEPTIPPRFVNLAALFGLFYFLQGLGDPTDGLLTQPLSSLLLDRGEDAGSVATFLFVVSLPWAVKPLYGLLSDFVPLAGYRRKSYLALTSALSAAAMFGLALQEESLDKPHLLAWLMPPAICVAFADVVIDALLIERGQPAGWTDRLQSIQWAALYGAAALAGWGGGYLAEHHAIRTGYLIVGLGSL
ncbi:MAG TPA: hypothetical protein VMF30_11210, partial [Pirellulales bacterium]|nr:hypothetical protein [Pirellulales bacterium]